MEFKQYPSYKKSGVEWLGGVPEHWVGSKFKYIFQEKQHTKNMNLPFGAISFGSVVYKEDKANLTDELKENYQEVLQGEFLVNPLNLNYDLKSLRTALSKIDVVVSSGYFVLKLKNNTFNKRYLEYLLYIFDIRKMKTLGAGIRQTLTFRDMAVCDVAIPSACEQTQIASFLDYETFRIDNLIAKQEKLIELLEEQRKSIISHAVTKGLNPNAPMKDSGVEWLGEVPEHWEVTRLKNIGKSIIGLTYSPNEICNPDDDSYLVLRSSNVQNGQLSFLDNVYVKSYVSEKLKIKKNDILICSRNGSRDLIGKNTIIKNPPKNSTFGAFMTVYRSEHADYVYWILNSYIFKAQAGSYLTTTVNQLTINNLNNMTVPFAPTSEQNEIVEFLSTENLKFNNLISKQKALIEKLKEYRASIISHAVTGKIDVREFGA
jgi:type I restriction enzyme S subunit